MKIFISIFIVVAGFSKIAHFRRIDETLGNFIVDVSSSLFSPSTITARFCIDDAEMVTFSRLLSRRNVLHDVKKLHEWLDLAKIKSGINHRNFIVLDLDCPGARDILMKVSENRMFIGPSRWLLLQDSRTEKKNLSDFENIFEDLQMLPDSEVTLARRIRDDFFRMLSPYRPNPQGELIIEDRGNWTQIDGLSVSDRFPTSRRRRDLRQTMLKSCLVLTNTDTFNHLEDYQDKHVDAVTKANYPWILHLTRRMNATVNFTSQYTWGYREKNGSWSGMIGLLDRREIDIGGTATFFITERIGVVEYIQLYTPTGSKFLFRRPPLSYVSNLFTLPFERSVWMAIGVFLVLVIGLLYLAMKWEYLMKTKEEFPRDDWSSSNDEVPTLSNNLLVIIGAVFQQGSSYEPRAVPTRIIVLMLLLTALSLYASYTANIVALLQSTATSINTPRDLMESPLKLGVYDIVYNHYYFQAAQDPERKEFYQTAVKGKKDVWISLEEGIKRVRKGLFAFHVEVGAGYQLMQETFEEDEKCGIHEVDFLNLLNPLLVIQYQSPYLEIIRVGALWIRETGLQYREISRLYTDKPVCHGQNSFISVGITDCYAALMTIVYGVASTLFVLLLEIIWHKWSSSEVEETEEVEEVASTIEFVD